MAGHLVNVGDLNVELYTVGTALWRGESLARQVCDRLPGVLPLLLEAALAQRHGVIRINSLRVELTDGEGLDPERLTAQLCQQIARELARELEHRTEQVQVWADRPWYLASYVLYRLGVGDTPAWCFDEFTALRELTPAQSLVTLAGAEPRLLTVLARTGHATLLLDALGGEGCRQLLAALLALPAAQRQPFPPWPGELPTTFSGTHPQQLAVAALRLLLSTCAAPGTDPGESPANLLPTAMALTSLAALLEAGSPLPQDLEAAVLQDPANWPAAGLLPASYRAALAGALNDPASRAMLAEQLHRIRQRTGTQDGSPRGSAAGSSPPLRLVSTRAGCALLLPMARGLGLHHLLGTGQLLGCIAAALGPEEEPTAQHDPLLLALCAADPDVQLPDWPPVPRNMQRRIDERALALLGEPGAGGWAGLLLAAFATALPGLRNSSAAYLRKQFLLVPGTLRLDARHAAVQLEGPDLAVVLAMAGLHGVQGPLPWLDGRILTLELTGLRP